MGVVKNGYNTNGVYKCQEYDIVIAASFLNGNDASSVEGRLNTTDVHERFRIMSRLTEFDIEPTRNEFIKISNEFVIPSKIVIVCWKALLKAGSVPGQRISRPIKSLSKKSVIHVEKLQ